MQVSELRNKLEREKGMRDSIANELGECQSNLDEHRKKLHNNEKAREIVHHVGLETQSQLSFHISDLVSLALAGVFPDPYDMKVEFVQRRNRTECDLMLERDSELINPIDAAGGGVVDVVSFALRTASWSMQRPRSSAVLILDEPFKYLSRDMMPEAGTILREIATRLDLQIIMVSHEDELIEAGDKIFETRKAKGGRSKVVEVS